MSADLSWPRPIALIEKLPAFDEWVLAFVPFQGGGDGTWLTASLSSDGRWREGCRGEEIETPSYWMRSPPNPANF